MGKDFQAVGTVDAKALGTSVLAGLRSSKESCVAGGKVKRGRDRERNKREDRVRSCRPWLSFELDADPEGLKRGVMCPPGSERVILALGRYQSTGRQQ